MHETASHPYALVHCKSVAHQVAEREDSVLGLGQRLEDVVGGVPNLGTRLMKLPEDARFLLPECLQGIYLPGYSVCFVHIVCG